MDTAEAAVLLTLVRAHGSIENILLGVRDTTFGEAACRVRTAHAPQNLPAIRNLAITRLERSVLLCSGCPTTARRPSARGNRSDPRLTRVKRPWRASRPR